MSPEIGIWIMVAGCIGNNNENSNKKLNICCWIFTNKFTRGINENKVILYKNRKYGYKYKVIGIICHIGKSYNEGHYYSIIRKNNIWYKVNDWRFDEYEYNINEIAEDAYILILENSKYKNTTNYIDNY